LEPAKPLLAAALLLALAVSAAAAPPYPVDAEVEAQDPLPGGPFYFTVRVTADRDVDAVVKTCVRVPGRGWGDWATLWSGHLRAGEARVLQGSDDRAVSAAGDYAVIVQVDFHSEMDYAVLGGSARYATYYVVYIHPYAKTLFEALGEAYGELEANYTKLKQDFDRLKAERDRLAAENEQLKGESERLRGENQQLTERVAQLQRELELADRALGLLILCAAASAAALAVAAVFKLVRMYRRGSGGRLVTKRE
jgi:hypothetical protein